MHYVSAMTPSDDSLHAQGFALLRGALSTQQVESLRAAFDEGVIAADRWPVRRGADWRHSLLDLDPSVQTACRLPALLKNVGELIGETFFLAQVEGREPLTGGGYQALHRDFSSQRPGDTAVAIAYLDEFGSHNGATRFVPCSHRPHNAPFDADDEVNAQQISGLAGDILVFDADLLHAASFNQTGARRRSLLMTFFAAPNYENHLKTAHLRGVRMDTSERFDRLGRVI